MSFTNIMLLGAQWEVDSAQLLKKTYMDPDDNAYKSTVYCKKGYNTATALNFITQSCLIA